MEIVEIKKGYKHTKLGWIPDDWEVNHVGHYYDFKNGLNKEKEFFGYGTPIINYKDVYEHTYIKQSDVHGQVSVNKSEKERYSTKRGDVFFTRTSETINEIGFTSVLIEDIIDGVFSGFVLRARPKEHKLIYPEFAGYCFNTFGVRKEIMRKSTYTTRALTNGSFLSEVFFAIPQYNEQKAIAKCLITWDTTITKLNALIKAKQKFKKGLMQQLLTGKRRLPGFNKEWHEKKLSYYIKYSPRPIQKPKTSFTKLGIKSHGKGTFQNNDFEPNDIAIDTLYQVKKDDLIVNITFAWEGAIAIVSEEDNNSLVSHRFPTYTFKNRVSDSSFFKQYIKTKRFQSFLELISPGGAGRNRVMNKKDFLKLKITIPEYDEQIAIAQILSAADKEIQLLQEQLNQLKLQKKGMMQQLLTGKKRLNN